MFLSALTLTFKKYDEHLKMIKLFMVSNGNSIDYVVTYNKAKPIEVMNKGCFVSEVKVVDPDTNGQVDIAIYKDSDPVNNPFNGHLIELV